MPMTRVLVPLSLAAALLLPTGGLAQDADEVRRGADVFKTCASCHMVGPRAINGNGPVLNGIVGRPAGSYPGYNYSKANRESGVTWDVEALTVYLRAPREFIPGTKMPFQGIEEDQQIADVIAYLGRFGADGNPVEP